MDTKDRIPFQGLPGITDYLEDRGSAAPVEIPELDHIVEAVVLRTPLAKDQSHQIVSLFFQEIRNSLIRGHVIDIRGFGTMCVSSPAITGNKDKVFVRYEPKRSMKKQLNKDKNDQDRG